MVFFNPFLDLVLGFGSFENGEVGELLSEVEAGNSSRAECPGKVAYDLPTKLDSFPNFTVTDFLAAELS